MTRSSKFIFARVFTIALLAGAFSRLTPGTRAQTDAPQTSPATPATKPVKGQFEVLHMMYNLIQVRSRTNPMEIRTFTYSPAIHDQMVQLFNEGGYQYGDKVEIWYQPKSQMALKIKGKPSKPN